MSRNTYFIKCPTAPTPARISRWKKGLSDKKFEVTSDEPLIVANRLVIIELYPDGEFKVKPNTRNVTLRAD